MLELRIATRDDREAIADLMERSIAELQRGFLTPEEIESSRVAMGLDLTLIDDGTYFCVMEGDALAGCGGWSRRATLYGGDHSAGRDSRLLDPEKERARIRAMYTHPDHTRKGVGRMILEASENAARAEGFRELEMAATMSGKPLYFACGYTVESEWFDTHGAVPVPLATMTKRIA
ncbi:GNAT family N-acetyltransferase [Qipengyuania sp. RANM35]|uniref:GNAT family N-acetyltransferase n=1 Tax=Qipengyuania sp. RANM35 TaxID=3068635 RepID=UPI0034DB50AA